ncbi:hypothetical protein FE257_003983 [Aspergillus nanangensis]|uniref:Metallo-beta-lactamase domain-containing protein n=1 Tax=Aspergillus nanangensis TaxID=2582783 RepID=A0AAD4CS18_ASPNN|nr:hypothetical protein FE257_003983 [Aspergillus nanangensis]
MGSHNQPPNLNIPPSSNTCDLFLIDTTCDILSSSSSLIEPEIKGHEFLNLPTYSFYLHNPRSNKRILFDMGCRKDWWNLPPAVSSAIAEKGIPGLRVTSDIDEILTAGGIDPASIDAVVWSHFHYDHTGNASRFPPSTDVVVGPGFKSAFLPGYPENPKSPFFSADFEGRQLNEISFNDSSPRIGQFQSLDYFADGSFYLLNTPGHTPGHISALVRVTPDTFVFLGGDISHFPGMYRPSEHIPMPEWVPPETKLDSRLPCPCPCALFMACHPGGAATEEEAQSSAAKPFYRPSSHANSWYEDPVEAQRSVHGLMEFDADENVFVAIAHDPALREVKPCFPEGTLNGWKTAEWKKRSHWYFLNELPVEGKVGREKLVDGRWKDGERVA